MIELTTQLLKAPRHLGIHSGGMVLTERPVGEVVPIEHARMDNRTVIQWDKDDAAWMGLVKFDLLGLGMLAALQHCFDLMRGSRRGRPGTSPPCRRRRRRVYDMLCRADSIGVFQVESRAQMGLLPRLQPRRFYDLVIQIALIRPGPIQGGAVHPFVRRKLGKEEVTYPHPKLEPVLKRTLGIPVFQEQLMQMAMAVGDCTRRGRRPAAPGDGLQARAGADRVAEAEALRGHGPQRPGGRRRPTTSTRRSRPSRTSASPSRTRCRSPCWSTPRSWMKLHYPAAFLAGLLRAQPMGFYSPSTLVSDARRHGVEVLRPDLCPLRSGRRPRAGRSLSLDEGAVGSAAPSTGRPAWTPAATVTSPRSPSSTRAFPMSPRPTAGTATSRSGSDWPPCAASGRVWPNGSCPNGRRAASYRSMEDLVRRTGLTAEHLEALAAAGALECLGLTRRQALWRAGSAALDQPGSLPGTLVESQPLLFDDPTPVEVLADDLWATGVSTEDHPIAQLRAELDARGVLSTAGLATAEPDRRVEVGGLVTHRQRPGTASGITFVSLEDEFGLVNVVCSVGVWQRFRKVARSSPALIVRGKLERSPEGVVNVVADHLEPLPIMVVHRSRDFH